MEDDLYEMSKPLARYRDDEDLEKFLKEREREDDPMLKFLTKKKKKGKKGGNPRLSKTGKSISLNFFIWITFSLLIQIDPHSKAPGHRTGLVSHLGTVGMGSTGLMATRTNAMHLKQIKNQLKSLLINGV